MRTDRAAHRPLPADSEPAQAMAVLARAEQDAVWGRAQAHNELRSPPRAFFPGVLAAFAGHRNGLLAREARALLSAAPTPAPAAKLTRRQLRALLKRAGRQRGIDAEAERLHEALRRGCRHQLPRVEEALGHQTFALLRQFDAACTNADQFEAARTRPTDGREDRKAEHQETTSDLLRRLTHRLRQEIAGPSFPLDGRADHSRAAGPPTSPDGSGADQRGVDQVLGQEPRLQLTRPDHL